MNGEPSGEHWIDRLAVRATRRESLKAALAGAMMTLPFAGAQRAVAANPGTDGDPHACQKGCTFVGHMHFNAAVSECNAAFNADRISSVGTAVYVNPLFGTAVTGAAMIRFIRCLDQAVLQQKATSFDCMQPECPGFDPTAPGGPCESCAQAGGQCCPWAGSPTGYGCCANDAHICCDATNLCRTC